MQQARRLRPVGDEPPLQSSKPYCTVNMVECEHIRVERMSIGRNPRRNNTAGWPSCYEEIPWCAHPKHSPRCHPTFGDEEPLTCWGDRGKCRLSDREFQDVD